MRQIFEISEYQIFTEIEGVGEPLLLLHSYWGNQCLFDPLARAFSINRTVIRIDLPGHGNSGNPPAGYTFNRFADVLHELLFKLNVDGKLTIIGHSMGGYVALAFAAKFPERIAALVLMHSPTKSADSQSIKLREREAGLLRKGKKELLLQATIPSNLAPENSSKMRWAIALLNQTSGQVTLDGALGSIYAINQRANSLATLQRAQYPILIVIGKHDKVYNAEEQLAEAEQIPNAEVLVLNHSGHLGFMEEEELVIREISEFLERRI